MVEKPPSYNSLFKQLRHPEVFYNIDRYSAERLLYNFIKTDRIFLIRFKEHNIFAISIYRYTGYIIHYLLKKFDDGFILSDNYPICVTNFRDLIRELTTNNYIGYQMNGENKPLCHTQLTCHQQH